MGTPLFPWQQYVMDVALEVDDDGVWAFDQIVLTVPRQSGKTFLIGPLVAQRMLERRTAALFSAQSREDAEDLWMYKIVPQIVDSPQLAPVVDWTRGVGNRRMWTRNGSEFKPVGPNPKKLHGKSPDLVWLDEVWAYPLEVAARLRQGYRPAWSMKPGQEWLSSTAGTADDSQWLNSLRRKGREQVEAGQRSGSAYFEWSTPEIVDGRQVWDLPDSELVPLILEHHPRRDHGLRASFVRSELADPGADRTRRQVVRDFANVTEPSRADTGGVFSDAVMERARSGAKIPGDARIGLGVAVDPDRRDASIGICARDGLGVAVTDDKRRLGTRWVAAEVIRLVDKYDVGLVAVVGAGPARSVADELDRAGVPLLRLTAADHAAACVGFADEFGSDHPSVTWNGGEEFRKAVAGAMGRRRSSGVVWESKADESIVSLPARTLAVWAFDHAPVPEPVVEPRVY